LEDGKYTFRIFVTSREGAPHKVMAAYDDRAGAEKLVFSELYCSPNKLQLLRGETDVD